MAIHTDQSNRDNFYNIVVTGTEHAELNSLQEQMKAGVEHLNNSRHARDWMIQLGTRYNEAVSAMMNRNHPNAVFLNSKCDHVRSESIPGGQAYGYQISSPDAAFLKRLGNPTQGEVKALFENDLSNTLLIEANHPNKFPADHVHVFKKKTD